MPRSQDREADLSLDVQIGIKTHPAIASHELKMGRLQRIVVTKLHVEEVEAMLVGRAGWTGDECNRAVQFITPQREDAALLKLLLLSLQLHPLLRDALLGKAREPPSQLSVEQLGRHGGARVTLPALQRLA